MGDTSSGCGRCGDRSGLCSHDDVFARRPLKNEVEISLWTVRDTDGLLHAAVVHRFIDAADGTIKSMRVATACAPQLRQRSHRDSDAPWRGASLPAVRLANGSVVVEYRVRDAVTCLRCHALSI